MVEVFKELFSDGWSAFKVGMSGLTLANILSILTCIIMSIRGQKKAKDNTDILLGIINNLKSSNDLDDKLTSKAISALKNDLGLTQENILIIAKYLCNGEDLKAIANNYRMLSTPTELTEQVLAEKEIEEKAVEEAIVSKKEKLKAIEDIGKNEELL